VEPFESLYRISKLLLSEGEEKTPEILLHRVLEATGAERGFIVLLENGKFVQKCQVRFDRAELSAEERRFSRTIVQEVLQTREILHSGNLEADGRFELVESVQQLGGASVVAAPLRHADEVYGAIYLEGRKGLDLFRPETLVFLRELTEVAGLFLKLALERDALRRQNRELTRDLFASHDFTGIVTRDPRMLELLRVVAQVADSDASILVRGESGTGKELIVRALHVNSPRRSLPFVTLHCTALPATILESELFGHKRGAFTGAQQDRAGRIAAADGGTVFLDEIAEIPVELQAKLLRFLQFGEIQRLGSDRVEKVDVRILTATHRDLPALIDEGQFRLDLYYRLKVVELHVPPLRERKGDIPLLLDHFTRKHWKRSGEEPRWSPEAEARLLEHEYPGNVRELQHIVERACLLARGPEMGVALLPHDVAPAGTKVAALTHEGLNEARESAQAEAELRFLAALLQRWEGNISRAARESGISRPYLQRLVSKHREALDPLVDTGARAS
jgi:transcriptional regulator with GAF, ATPase, and Fis domain